MNQTLADQFGPDTIRKFMNAAPLRFEEAEALMREEHHLAAIYLFGYSAEMLIKAAYFRAQRLGSTIEIGPETRHRIEVRARMDGLMSSEPMISSVGLAYW